jgi:alkylation response protein AidB-like acyl-CoA dehydrogenase
MVQVSRESDELVQRASDLYPLLRGNAPRADAERRLPEENIEALVDDGFFRVWVPRRYGGYEADPVTQLEMTAELARACPATGWVVGVTTVLGWIAGCLSQQGQDDIFGADPDARICGILNPTAPAARPAEGGHIVSGSWSFASGCLHSTWAQVPTPAPDAAGNLTKVCLNFIPISELQIKDTWYTLGMRGSGSNTLVAEEVFVPAHRTLVLDASGGSLAGRSLNPYENEALYRIPLGMFATPNILGPFIGMARAAFEHVVERLPKRGITYGPYTEQAKVTSTQLLMAEAATKIDTATFHARRAMSECQAAGEAGEPPSDLIRTKVRHDSAHAARTCKEAVDLLLSVSGASAAADGNFLQQIHRDMTTAALHAVLRTDQTLELYGSTLCGQEPTGSFLY